MRCFVKKLLRGVSIILVTPLLLSHTLTSMGASADYSLESHSQALSLIPGTLGSYLRVAFYRWTLAECHPTATIGFGVLFSKTAARIERHVYIGPRCLLGWVHIQSDTLIGPAVQIPSGPATHGIACNNVPIRFQPGTIRCVTVGHGCWIGAGSTVLADVADQTVVGAGSIVTKPLPANVVAHGNPAKVSRSRDATAEHASASENKTLAR